MDFQNYYQSELSYLREVGKLFAEKHPSLAGMLAERGGDPDVERLLEGFAFVAARFRQRIDDNIPELAESLSELLLPHLLRPTPAATIVQFKGASDGARGAYALPAGLQLLSTPVRGTRCRFRTTRPLDLLPLTLNGLRLDDASSSSPTLTLRFELAEGARSSVFRRAGVRLHLHGELATTSQLYLWLVRHLSSVSVHAPGGRTVELGARCVRPVGLDEHDALVPWPSFSPLGPRLLLEQFTLQAKFLFVDIVDLDRAADLEGNSFELVFRFAKPPALPARLAQDAVRLHCVPAVNLFDVSADAVRTSALGRPVLLRAQGVEPLHAEVFEVKSAVGMSPERRERRSYAPFHAFRHLLPGSALTGFYKLTREKSPIDEGLHTYIQLTSGSAAGSAQHGAAQSAKLAPSLTVALDPETLSIELVCTNRSLPTELQVGDVHLATADTPAGVTFANITQISRPTRPPVGSDLIWHFVSHLGCSHRSMADIEALKAMLLLYNRQDEVDYQGGAANRARVEAIRKVSMRATTRIHLGAPVRGSLFELELEQSGFGSEGDAYLFGAVLHRFFALGAPLNSFSDLQLVLLPTKLSYRFQAELS